MKSTGGVECSENRDLGSAKSRVASTDVVCTEWVLEPPAEGCTFYDRSIQGHISHILGKSKCRNKIPAHIPQYSVLKLNGKV